MELTKVLMPAIQNSIDFGSVGLHKTVDKRAAEA